MSEINVTPMVDVMLVLLIIFMVAAPLLQVGVPIELPQSKGKQLKVNQEPLAISVKNDGSVYIGETPIKLDEIAAKLKAIAKVMGRISAGGFRKVSLVTELEEGG
jgi:biopolymer transport protein TolR